VNFALVVEEQGILLGLREILQTLRHITNTS
jgi:hypothetical protein